MKLFRFGEPGIEKPGVLWNNKKLDASSFGEDYNEAFFEHEGISRLKKWVEANHHHLPVVDDRLRFASCVQRPSKIICIGLNYSDHAKETGATLPTEPILFFKSTTALSGPNDNVVIPKNSVKTDWEVELAFVIGKKATYVDEKEALNYVAGYCIHNDYSEREFQLERGGQWVKGKSCDTFAPMGPYLLTPDEVKDVDNLRLWLKLNGKMVQDGTTANMVFKTPFLIHYISQFMTLLPGDVITTGTPAGVGLGMKPPFYLKPGDVVELGIDGMGEQKQNVVAWS
ncbi:MAG: ureidoglycolate lyase [Azospira oryzae]|jgi:2,4-diketo-3-deoxy-L-fuconate hydrolase|nr:ureidoglycolate lyase [Cytophaga sp.]PZR32960.1 MAG: ureidoglycolate lyase [Azospira oryzae]